jgi:hypothetical protein
MAVINRFPARRPLATEGVPAADDPFQAVAAWTEDPRALAVFLYNSAPEACDVYLDLTPLRRRFAFWFCDQVAADIAGDRRTPTLPVEPKQKAGAVVAQDVRYRCPPASFARIVVKE